MTEFLSSEDQGQLGCDEYMGLKYDDRFTDITHPEFTLTEYELQQSLNALNEIEDVPSFRLFYSSIDVKKSYILKMFAREALQYNLDCETSNNLIYKTKEDII